MILEQFRMDGRVALITGAGRGIGLAMAQALASVGCAVAVQDIDLEVAQAAVREINSTGGRAVALGGDVADLSVCSQLVSQTIRELGGLHVLINNAAVQTRKWWTDLSADDILNEFRANLLAPIILCQKAVPVFKAQKWGRIINLGSVQQRGGNPHLLAYSLSKAAIEKLTTALARELARDQITVNTIAPGWFNTWRNRGDFTSPQDMIEKGRHIPIGRIGQPQDCAGVTLLLCSDAGSYITGQTIYVSGGM